MGIEHSIEVNMVGSKPVLRLGGRDVFLHVEPKEDPEAYVFVKNAHNARELAGHLRGAMDALVEWAESQERKAVAL